MKIQIERERGLELPLEGLWAMEVDRDDREETQERQWVRPKEKRESPERTTLL